MTLAVGIDVGGTKVAAGLVDTAAGRVVRRERVPTRPERGGAAVLADCAALAAALGGGTAPVGVGLCEVVDLDGRPVSAETVDWRALDVAGAFVAPRVVVESDVRAAAIAEARFGAGRGLGSCLHVVCGTGASACFLVAGEPWRGARGKAITLGAPPVEELASGLGLARRAGVPAERALADPAHAALVEEAAALLGRTLAALVNLLDPEAVVVSGGLGTAPAFLARVEVALRRDVVYGGTRDLPVLASALGADGGVVGAALAAVA